MRRSIELTGVPGRSLITNDLGEYAIVSQSDCETLMQGALDAGHPRYRDLEARGMLDVRGPAGGLADAVRRTRRAFLMEGPSLHIFAVTLRCDHACTYCQVSRAAPNAQGYDMSEQDALLALERVFESDAKALTIEFQGGEPALRFDLVRLITEAATARALAEGRDIRFTMATTLQLLSDEDLAFCRDFRIHLSTSFDGPAEVHNGQRISPFENTWGRSVAALSRARSVLGDDGVAALPTITRPVLSSPEALVDTYVEQGFSAIFLRPLAPYGFGRKAAQSLGYTMDEFVRFYERAFEHILRLNQAGTHIEETYATILLRHILTPFHSGYMDLRSPAGAGLGTLVYNYDGLVYPSDEARMAARTGDKRFALGPVSAPLDELLTSDAMRWLARGAIAEQQEGCRACAFVPYCGADPVHHAIVHGAPDAARTGTDFCGRNMALFQYLFAKLHDRDPETIRTLLAWTFVRPRSETQAGWIEQ